MSATCRFTLLRGHNKGQSCGKKCKNGTNFCYRHHVMIQRPRPQHDVDDDIEDELFEYAIKMSKYPMSVDDDAKIEYAIEESKAEYEEEQKERYGECPICMEILNPDTHITHTRCGHHFHTHCITQWTEQDNTCPCCRTII